MANNNGGSGGSGSKFVSVNLNKLYGQPSHHNHQFHSSSYGPGVGTNRARPGGHASAGGGMVVLSRNRPLQKAMPKLSVPPPLNLPSLRKEYEKIDSSGAGVGMAGGVGSGTGSRPSSSGMGWTKPRNLALQEKEVYNDARISESMSYTESAGTKVSGAYMPPSARFGGEPLNVAPVEKAMVLRGEDFPSLRAALPSTTGPAQKQKEGSFQKVKQLVSEELSSDLRNSSPFKPSHHIATNGVKENSGQNPRPSFRVEHGPKQDDPLPLISLNPRSDWADDERDTGHVFSGRSGRDQELPRGESYWDRDFDVPRSNILPHKPPNSLYERRAWPFAKGNSTEVLKSEPYREINSWRTSSIHKERPTSPYDINVRNNGVVTKNRDTGYVRRDAGLGRQGGQRNWNHSIESPSYRKDVSKSVVSLGDSSQKDFNSDVYDERDPFTGNLVGLVKKKKDVIKQTNFHDPERESFEAELERVQKMQEMERQRIAEEQERVLEQAQREDEERRRMEEEAREAAWIAEQERLNAIQKAEEQKLAREEEKKKMVMEEERRKQAAKQKLLELEARMAKREAEVPKGSRSVDTGGKDSDASMDSEIDNWDVSQRMVERITSASSESSAIDRPFDQPFDRLQISREASNPWKREAFQASSGGRSFMPLRSPDPDGFPHLGDQDHRWNSFESEFYNNVGEKYGGVGWGQGYSHNNMHSERLYINPESDKVYSYGRSRYSMKQPRVLPPPSFSVPRSSVRGENEISAPSSSLESTARTGNLQQSDIVDLQQGFILQNQEKKDTLRCDSQSSLSVSSPPSSPTHLSHDELDDSGEGKDIVNDEPGDSAALKSVMTDEDEEWSLENQDELQEQEEYDEDDGYGDEDEVHEGSIDNINLTRQFEHMQLEEKSVTENIVLGFNEGVEVKIPGEDEFDKDSKTDRDMKMYTVDMSEMSVVKDKQAAVDDVVNEHPQNVAESTVEMPSSSSSGPSATPVKLQFGLFSGPTLIPSPVPSIQIGSIQMPLPPVGSSMCHLHPSEPPLFQFGQLSYTPQPISLVQPNIHHSQFIPYQFSLESSATNMKNESGSANLLSNQSNLSHAADNIIAFKPGTQFEEKSHDTTNNGSQLHFAPAGSRGLSGDKNVPLSKAPGPSNRGSRTTYLARNSGPRSSQPYNPIASNEFQRKHRRPVQRTEFRVRQTANNFGLDDTSNGKGIVNPTRSGYRRQTVPAMSLKRVVCEAEIIPESNPGKETSKTKTQMASSSADHIKRNIPEEDVDAPLQSGVVHVFKQPGIECPSDEDDFIEVRSKRQMLNDRREQREKEIKAKSRVTKQPRKAYGTSTGPSKKEPADDSSTTAPQLSAPVITFTVDTDDEVADKMQTAMGDWGIAQTDQQVIPLTQTQLDEAMKPPRFSTTHITSTSEPVLPVSSSSSPINSLLAGEKIQFGAVTSPTILPPSSRVVSHVIGAPSSFRPETTENSQKNSRSENDCVGEVDAAVSAVDEAAVGTDEGVKGGFSGDQPGSQSKPEESLSVSLPADLSVETPPISLWTPLPSPQGSSPQMLSHFHGPTPSHFPFYDMNHHPMVTGPVFAFGPHDEAGGPKSQPQKPTGSGSRPIGPWQNHSGMDSFYGPFIGSPGGIPGGVQAPPHMVVYNHYAPVGQFGQVGLSFMGPAYIPSGKQPDWKHDPISSTRGEDDMSSMNMVSGPRNLPNMQPPVQHLGAGSPLLPMHSSLTMFDVPPFQTAPDMTVQARWSHIPAPPLHAVPLSLPLQQQADPLTGPSQFSSHGGCPVDQSSFPPNRLSKPQPSTITHFPDELGLVDSSGLSISTSSASVTVSHISSDTARTGDDGHRGGITINNNSGSSAELKNQQQQGKSHGGGYGMSPRNKAAIGQWSHHRRVGFHGRYQPMGNEKGFPSSTKVKQIYVAKQPTASSSTLG